MKIGLALRLYKEAFNPLMIEGSSDKMIIRLFFIQFVKYIHYLANVAFTSFHH